MRTVRRQLAEGEIEKALGRVEGALGDEAVQDALVVEVPQVLLQRGLDLREERRKYGCRCCRAADGSQDRSGKLQSSKTEC